MNPLPVLSVETEEAGAHVIVNVAHIIHPVVAAAAEDVKRGAEKAGHRKEEKAEKAADRSSEAVLRGKHAAERAELKAEHEAKSGCSIM
jgi:hypothetical protein